MSACGQNSGRNGRFVPRGTESELEEKEERNDRANRVRPASADPVYLVHAGGLPPPREVTRQDGTCFIIRTGGTRTGMGNAKVWGRGDGGTILISRSGTCQPSRSNFSFEISIFPEHIIRGIFGNAEGMNPVFRGEKTPPDFAFYGPFREGAYKAPIRWS